MTDHFVFFKGHQTVPLLLVNILQTGVASLSSTFALSLSSTRLFLSLLRSTYPAHPYRDFHARRPRLELSDFKTLSNSEDYPS